MIVISYQSDLLTLKGYWPALIQITLQYILGLSSTNPCSYFDSKLTLYSNFAELNVERRPSIGLFL